jgi:hypothetical protein
MSNSYYRRCRRLHFKLTKQNALHPAPSTTGTELLYSKISKYEFFEVYSIGGKVRSYFVTYRVDSLSKFCRVEVMPDRLPDNSVDFGTYRVQNAALLDLDKWLTNQGV